MLPFPQKPVVGMVHLAALPGSVRFGGDVGDVIRRAVEDASTLAEGGVDAVMVENFFDAPFHKDAVPPHTISAMTLAASAVRAAVSIPIGVNVLRNDVRSAIAIAHVCQASFVRCNVYVGAAVTDQGIIEGAAAEALRYRGELDAQVVIWADVGVKHAVSLGFPPLEQQARDAVERGLADALIVTGAATGAPTPIGRIRRVKQAVPQVPVLVGSGVDAATVADLLQVADGVIVGTSLKSGGHVSGPVDVARVRDLVSAARGARSEGSGSIS